MDRVEWSARTAAGVTIKRRISGGTLWTSAERSQVFNVRTVLTKRRTNLISRYTWWNMRGIRCQDQLHCATIHTRILKRRNYMETRIPEKNTRKKQRKKKFLLRLYYCTIQDNTIILTYLYEAVKISLILCHSTPSTRNNFFIRLSLYFCFDITSFIVFSTSLITIPPSLWYLHFSSFKNLFIIFVWDRYVTLFYRHPLLGSIEKILIEDIFLLLFYCFQIVRTAHRIGQSRRYPQEIISEGVFDPPLTGPTLCAA